MARLRHDLRGLILVPAALLLLGVFVGGIHHHDGGSSERACAVCTISHAPATVTIAGIPLPAPAEWSERLQPALAHAAVSRPTHEHRGRAPPRG